MLFAFSIINVTVLRLALYHLYIVLCGVEVRALDCRAQNSGFEAPLKLKQILFLNFVA